MNESIETTPHGAILYDSDILRGINDVAFDVESWSFAVPVTGTFKSAGRGNTMYVSEGQGEFVLRHYLRGGAVGRLVRDNYLWLGEQRNRAFREWRLLARLRDLELPVPRPAAARYRRRGPFYTADLLTVRVPGIRSLSDRLTAAPGDEAFWERLGSGICRFHRAGVFHADLNVSNVQVDQDDQLWLLDFDRGRILPPGAWQQRTLARFHRSLRKVKQFDRNVHFRDADWQIFLDGYFRESRSA